MGEAGGEVKEGESHKAIRFSLIYWVILVCVDKRTPTRKHDRPRGHILYTVHNTNV